MQDQDFTKDQNLENDRNQETVNTSPEVETTQNFVANEEPEQETVVFTRPVEITVEAQTETQNISSDDEELFGRYEIKNWNWTPRLYKILAFSAIFNILFLVAVAQTDILRTKACDSPLVGGFCQVIDTLYVGGKVLTTDSGFVDKEYERTELENSEIVWLDKTAMEQPLEYPAGYFQIANPENYMTDQNGTIPGISDFPAGITPNPSVSTPNPTIINPTTPNPTTSGNSGVFSRKQRLPKNKQGIVPDMSDVNVPKVDDDKTDTKDPKNTDTTATTKETKDNPVKSNPSSDSVPVDVQLNRQPLIDHGKYVSEKLNKNEVDLKTPFVVQARGKLDKDGKIDQKTFKIVQAQSDDKDMIDIIVRSIAAMSDSGYLQYIKQLSGKDLDLSLSQDEQNISAVVESEMESDKRANSLKTALNFAISIVKSKKKDAIDDGSSDSNDVDDLALLEGAKVETNGKKIIIKFDIKKDIAQPMLERKLKISRETPSQQTKPNGTAQTDKSNANTGK